MIKNTEKLKKGPVPGHVGIIMDGNGRWAESRGLPRKEGHKAGADIIEPLLDSAMNLGIKAVSLYAFSVENWARPVSEIRGLWSLLEYFFAEKLETIKSKNIRIVHSGSLNKLPGSTKKVIQKSIEETKNNRAIVLNFCINYGGRQEIVHAVNEWVQNSKAGEKITSRKLEKYLYTKSLPEVDLIIRTSGESRISNFLLWQCAYAELVFTDTLWPDFDEKAFYKAIGEFQNRERRFGGI